MKLLSICGTRDADHRSVLWRIDVAAKGEVDERIGQCAIQVEREATDVGVGPGYIGEDRKRHGNGATDERQGEDVRPH